MHNVWQWIKGIFWIGWWLFGLSALTWSALHWWSGDRFWPVRLATYLMPWLLVGLLPGAAAAAAARRRRLLVVLGIPTIFIVLTFAPLFLPSPSTVLAGGSSFKVMSYNVLYSNRDVSDMAELIRQEQPDILLLQELLSPTAATLRIELADLYPDGALHFAYVPEVAQAIVSRYPLSSPGLNEESRALKVWAETPGGEIAIWNVHARTPMPWLRQYRQLSDLTAEAASVEEPLIVGGDFNTTDQSEAYRLINRQLRNAHWEAGWGFGFSFPADAPRIENIPVPIPVIRIDHIFYNDHFLARNARTLSESGGSDHLPTVATLSLVR